MVRLVFSIIPTTIPAAWIYWREGWSAPGLLIGGVLIGLWAGTDLGARMANRAGETALHRTLLGFVSAMAIYIACRALARGAPVARRRPLWHSRSDKTATL
jgi:uncharacterized protein